MEQHRFLAFLVRKLRDEVLLGGHRDALRERIHERLTANSAAGPDEIKKRTDKLAETDREVAQGAKRLLGAPDEIADLLATELSALRRERDRLSQELDAIQAATTTDVESQIDGAMDMLWRLHEELVSAPPARLRELLRRMVSRIDVWFEPVQQPKRLIRRICRGAIGLRPDPILIRLVSRGDRI